MIASNYVKHPEVMQFQRELWSKSKRDTILFRIAGLIMRGAKAPKWLQETRARAKTLAKKVRAACLDWINGEISPTPSIALQTFRSDYSNVLI